MHNCNAKRLIHYRTKCETLLHRAHGYLKDMVSFALGLVDAEEFIDELRQTTHFQSCMGCRRELGPPGSCVSKTIES